MGVPHAPRFSIYTHGSDKIWDLSYFMRCLYRHWHQKGFWGVVTAAAVDFLNTFVVFLFAFIFTTHFRWELALRCSENECAEALLFSKFSTPYVIKRNFLGSTFGSVFLISSFVATLYEGWLLLVAICIHREIDQMSRSAGIDTGFLTPIHRSTFQYCKRLRFSSSYETVGFQNHSDCVLTSMPWELYLERICTYVNRRRNLKFYSEPLNALRALQALLQRENFLVAIYDSGMLDYGVLSFLGPDAVSFVLSTMFDPFNTVYIRHEETWRVRRRLLTYIVVHLCLFLFITTYSTVKVLVKNAGQFKSNYRELSQNDWNQWARWRFRLFNEVDHLHECRLANAREIAARMVSHLAVSNGIGRFMRRLSSVLIFIFIALSFLNTSLLVSGHFAGLSFVWWLTISLLVYTSFPEVDPREREYDYRDDLKKLVGATHFTEPVWHLSGDSFYHALSKNYFKSLFHIILQDFFSHTMLPFLLLYALWDGSVSKLLEFMRNSSVFVEGVGSVVFGSAFEVTLDYATPLAHISCPEETSDLSTFCPKHTLMSGLLQKRGLSLKQGMKLQHSIVSFAAVYPQWMSQHLESDVPAGDSLHAFLKDLHKCVETHQGDLSQSCSGDQGQKSSDSHFSTQKNCLECLSKPDAVDRLRGRGTPITSYRLEHLWMSELNLDTTPVCNRTCHCCYANKDTKCAV